MRQLCVQYPFDAGKKQGHSNTSTWHSSLIACTAAGSFLNRIQTGFRIVTVIFIIERAE